MVGWMFGDGVGGTLSASVESGCVTAREVVFVGDGVVVGE